MSWSAYGRNSFLKATFQASKHAFQQSLIILDKDRWIKVAHPQPARLTVATACFSIIKHLHEFLRQFLFCCGTIRTRNQHATWTLSTSHDQLACAARRIRGDHRQTAGHGFEQHKRKRFRARTENEHIRACHELEWIRLPSKKEHVIVDSKLFSQTLEGAFEFAAADDGELAGSCFPNLCEGAQEMILGLLWCKPTGSDKNGQFGLPRTVQWFAGHLVDFRSVNRVWDYHNLTGRDSKSLHEILLHRV